MDQANFPIVVEQGVSYIQPFYYFDDNNLPINLTGCTARMQARPTVNSDDPPLFDWTTDGGQIEVQGTDGCVLVSVSATETALLDQYANAVYDILLTFPSGLVEQLVSGPISIIGRVTR